ncbi:MAG: hypothetical protein ABI432_12175 [Flavobacteriales bacterium]
MMRSSILLASILFASLASAQEPVKEYSIPGHFDLFTTDEMGNVYALRGDVLELYNAQGRSWVHNSVKTFGRIQCIDAFYSLKPMVFSPDQGQMAVLDNTLSPQGSVINLSRAGYSQVVLACMGVQNAFWFFDQRELALVRVDNQLQELANTGRLDQLLGFTPKPIAMQEADSRLYLNDPDQGILVFDLFGTYVKTIAIKGARSFEVRGEMLFFFGDAGAQLYDMKSFAVQPFVANAPDSATVRDMRVERGRVHLLLEDQILVRPLGTEP